jgi:hypothetical protein
MAISSLGITLDDRDSIELAASRSEPAAWMRIHVGSGYCEIHVEREHVYALRDQLPGVLAALARVAADDELCGRAEIAVGQASDAASRARKLAEAAANAGIPDIAASLLKAAEETATTADAVDAAIQAVQAASVDADRAVDQLVYVTQLADTSLREVSDGAGGSP